MIMHLTQPQNGRDNRRAVTGTARLILSEFTAEYAVIMAEGTGVEPVRPATGQRILSPLVLADDQPLRLDTRDRVRTERLTEASPIPPGILVNERL
jgi:hypothetical protein